jgi:putative ABC transport system permease protein
VLARYTARYSVRALDLTIDSSMLWVGAGLAIIAALLLAFVPKLPSSREGEGFSLAGGTSRITGTANRKLKVFALVQIAASFVLVSAAAATVNTLLSLEFVRAGFETHRVLAVNVPVMRDGKTASQVVDRYREAMQKIRELPGVVNVAVSTAVPWRDSNDFDLEFGVDGQVPAVGEEHPHALYEAVSPDYFATLGLPILAGRDFTDADRGEGERVAIVSESLARTFPKGEAVNHMVMWTDPVLQFAGIKPEARRIVGVVPDLDIGDLVPKPMMTVYHPIGQEQMMLGGRLVVDARSDPYALVQPITRIIRGISANQPVERAATLEDIRAAVLSPQRLNAVVSGVFAGVALLIAVVGVAGVLAFSVSGRTREFGIRLAVGSEPRGLLLRVMAEGAAMAVGGLALGLACGYWLAQLAGSFVGDLKMPGVLPVAGSALVLLVAAVVASAIPAARAARVDVMQALRTE